MASSVLDTLDKDDTIIDRIRKFRDDNPEKEAFVFYDKVMTRNALTRNDVLDQGGKFAAILRGMGIVKGDIVCNTLVNSRERIVTNFGTLFAGGVAMHGQILLADGEDIIQNWKDSGCKAIIVDPTKEKGAAHFLKRLEHKDETTGELKYTGLPCLVHVIPVVLGEVDGQTGTWLRTLDQVDDRYFEDSLSPDDLAYILTTSGSTGFTKLVPHSHRSIIKCANTGSDLCKVYNDKDVYFNHRSFGWIGGMPLLILTCGTTRVAVDYSCGIPDQFGHFLVDVFNLEKVVSSVLIPIDIKLLLDALDSGAKLNTLSRNIATGGGPLSTSSMRAVGIITECVTVIYGGTETGFIYGLDVIDCDSYENSCVGYPRDGVITKMLDDDDEQEVPMGKTGEVYIQSPTIAQGYINQPEKTAKAFLSDGWFRTSDIGHVNEKGQLFVYCRKANAINHKGFLHYPGWMEARINKHPQIHKSLVVGIPDPHVQEELCLCVIKEPNCDLTEEDVKTFCKSLFITDQNDDITPTPKYYLFVDKTPLNDNGKVDRKAMRAEALKRLCLE